MHRFTNIVFSPLGIKDNPAAIRRVTELARNNGARLTLLGAVPAPSRRHRLLHRAEVDAAIESAHRRGMKGRLERWREAADGVPTRVDVQIGNPALVILGHVIDEGHDLVVVTSDDDREDHSAVKRLLRKCPCPVWVIRPTRARTQRVVVAVDPEPDENALNHMLLELAASMVEFDGGELHLVHAWELYGESTMRSSSFAAIPSDRVDELVEIERIERTRAVEELVASSKAADAPWRMHVIKGRPWQVVPEFVHAHRINLLVMGTVARTGLPGLIMGNTAEQVLDAVQCSVIAVKPSTFVSPLDAKH